MEVLALLLTDALAEQDGLGVLVQQVKKLTVLIKCNIIIIHIFQLCVVLLVEMEVLALLPTDALAKQDGLEVLVQQVKVHVLHCTD